MPGKSRVTTTYQKVNRTRKVQKKKQRVEINTFYKDLSERSPLVRYVSENAESGLSLQELIEQFREFDCEHNWFRVAASPGVEFFSCHVCFMVVKKEKKNAA